MAKSTGIILVATGIGMGNEFVQGFGLNIRMGVAGLGAALFLTGVEKINEQAAVGIAVIAFITVMLTPFKGKSPSQEVLGLINSNKGGIGVAAMPGAPKSGKSSPPGPNPGIIGL